MIPHGPHGPHDPHAARTLTLAVAGLALSQLVERAHGVCVARVLCLRAREVGVGSGAGWGKGQGCTVRPTHPFVDNGGPLFGRAPQDKAAALGSILPLDIAWAMGAGRVRVSLRWGQRLENGG